MKKLMMIALLFSFLTARAGTEAGNGGDGIAIEAFNLATSIREYVLSDHSRFQEIDLGELDGMLRKVVIETTENELRDFAGDPKDAINLRGPSPRIVIQRTRWQGLLRGQKRKLVFHEMLSLLELESSNDYRISTRLDEAKASRFDDMIPDGNFPVSDILLQIACSNKIDGQVVGRGYAGGPLHVETAFFPQKLIAGLRVTVGAGTLGFDERTRLVASLDRRSADIFRLTLYRIADDSTASGTLSPTSDQFTFQGDTIREFDLHYSNGKMTGLARNVSFSYSYTVNKIRLLNAFGNIELPTADAGSFANYRFSCSVSLAPAQSPGGLF